MNISCPSCRSVVTVASNQQGEVVSCADCGQKMRVPKRTAAEKEEAFTGRQPSVPASGSAGPRARARASDWEDDEPEFDDRPRRRRPAPKSYLGLWLGLGLGVAALAGLGVLTVILVLKKASPSNPGRHHEAAGGFSYVPPPGWEVKPFPGLKFQIVAGPAQAGFAPNINIVEELSNLDMRSYLEANLLQMQGVFQGFRLLERQEFSTGDGLQGHKIIFERPEGGRQLRQCQYFFGRGNRKLTLTATMLAHTGTRFDAVLDECARSFKLD
jgi:hypothetical protein